jgi:hypothetical protein
MLANGQVGAVHPFMVGLGMDALVHWYELNLAEGHPDYRVLPVIKEALNGLWRDSWLPEQKMFDYNRYILPVNRSLAYTALNNLVCEGYMHGIGSRPATPSSEIAAISCSSTLSIFRKVTAGAENSLANCMSSASTSCATAKGLLLRRWLPRIILSPPYADTDPPISEKVNCDRNYYPGCKAGTIGSTTATIFWDTYKPATTQLIYYGKTTAYGQSSDLDKTMTLSHTVNLANLLPVPPTNSGPGQWTAQVM